MVTTPATKTKTKWERVYVRKWGTTTLTIQLVRIDDRAGITFLGTRCVDGVVVPRKMSDWAGIAKEVEISVCMSV